MVIIAVVVVVLLLLAVIVAIIISITTTLLAKTGGLVKVWVPQAGASRGEVGSIGGKAA